MKRIKTTKDIKVGDLIRFKLDQKYIDIIVSIKEIDDDTWINSFQLFPFFGTDEYSWDNNWLKTHVVYKLNEK